jgi:hypothetical protein
MGGSKEIRGVRDRHESLSAFPKTVKQKAHYPTMN